MDFIVRPYESVGPIRFDMSIARARASLAEPLRALGRGFRNTRSFLKGDRDSLPIDDFNELGLHIHYRIDAERLVVDAVELFNPAIVLIEGISVFSEPFPKICEQLRLVDPGLTSDSDWAKSTRLGLSLWDASCGDEADRPPKSAWAFSRGYWGRPPSPPLC